jgi:hypothetical protein
MTTAVHHISESALEQLIGRLYSSHGQSLAEFVSTMPQENRVDVAVLCYGRVHLREIALMIAATCDRVALIEAAGKIMGDILFTQSRQTSSPLKQRSYSRRPTITVPSFASAFALAERRTAIAEPDDGEDEATETDEPGTETTTRL